MASREGTIGRKRPVVGVQEEIRRKPPFHCYGHRNQRPVHPEDYMKTYNINPQKSDQVYPFLKQRRSRTNNYDGWRQCIARPDQVVSRPKHVRTHDNHPRTNPDTISTRETRPITQRSHPDDADTDEQQYHQSFHSHIPSFHGFPSQTEAPRDDHPSMFVNFEPCSRPEMQPRNYRGLPPHYTHFIVPAGKRIPVSMPASECFRMFD